MRTRPYDRRLPVKQHTMLIIASLLSILLLMFHFTDDILREGGMAVRGASNLIAVPILFAWLYERWCSRNADRVTSSCSSDR